jgi:membrane fusion protein, multidrug efflux system
MRKELSLLFLAGLTTILLTGCESFKQEESQESGSMQMPSIPVVAATPFIKDVTVYIESIGTLQPSLLTEIRPEISGTLSELFVVEGQWVEKDSPLFGIDSKPFLLKIQAAEAQLAIDQTNLQAIQKKLTRLDHLVQKNLVPQSEWEELESQAEISRASIHLDRVYLDTVKYDLERCIQKAPIDGRVGKVDAYPGLVIANGQPEPVLTISKMDPLIAEFTLTEKEISQIHSDSHQIEIKPLSSDLGKSGIITFLDNQFEPKTGQLLVRAKVQNVDFSLRPGQIVKVQIPIATQNDAKLIPQRAIRYNQQGPYVYVISPDMTVTIRQIVLGDEYQSDQIVLDGLESSEQIVVDGHLRLFPGLKVEVKS